MATNISKLCCKTGYFNSWTQNLFCSTVQSHMWPFKTSTIINNALNHHGQRGLTVLCDPKVTEINCALFIWLVSYVMGDVQYSITWVEYIHWPTHTHQPELSRYNNNTDLKIQTIMDLGIPMYGRKGMGVSCVRMKRRIILEHKTAHTSDRIH